MSFTQLACLYYTFVNNKTCSKVTQNVPFVLIYYRNSNSASSSQVIVIDDEDDSDDDCIIIETETSNNETNGKMCKSRNR